jgi:hypothetical protein
MTNFQRLSRLNFSLRTLLIGVTLVCVFLALFPYQAREHKQRRLPAQQLVASLGGQINPAGWSSGPTPGDNWLARLLGYVDLLEPRWRANLNGSSVSSADLDVLAQCDWIRGLDLSTYVQSNG